MGIHSQGVREQTGKGVARDKLQRWQETEDPGKAIIDGELMDLYDDADEAESGKDDKTGYNITAMSKEVKNAMDTIDEEFAAAGGDEGDLTHEGLKRSLKFWEQKAQTLACTSGGCNDGGKKSQITEAVLVIIEHKMKKLILSMGQGQEGVPKNEIIRVDEDDFGQDGDALMADDISDDKTVVTSTSSSKKTC